MSGFEFNPGAVTSSYCAALQKDKACLGLRVVKEFGDTIERQFSCKVYRVKLERVDTNLGHRRIQIGKRCEQCLREHPESVQPDFDIKVFDNNFGRRS